MERMEDAPSASRARNIFVIALILLPLILIAVVKYAPSLNRMPRVSSVSILPPKVHAPDEFDYLAQDVRDRLAGELSAQGVHVRRTPSDSEMTETGEDWSKLARQVQADALILASITVDSGIIQLNLQIVDPETNRVLFNRPYQSSRDRYPEMVRAAGAALTRALQP